jgi:pilus assembly protein Flp/PilA
MQQLARRFRKHDDGATSIEYALIAGLVSIVILSAIHGMSSSLVTIFTSVNSGLGH